MLNFLLEFPNKELINQYQDKSSAQAFIKRLLMTLDRINCEKDTNIFIDRQKKIDFINDSNKIDSLNQIRIGYNNINDFLLQYFNENSIKFISNNGSSFDYKVGINEFEKIDAIFNKINIIRSINRNDFRHIEGHPKRLSNKSPFIGGLKNFDNAENLLRSAIGDAKTNKKYLLNIDLKNQNFIIRFEDENFMNQYHCFHIASTISKQIYIADNIGLQKIMNVRQGMPRALKLVYFRNELPKIE